MKAETFTAKRKPSFKGLFLYSVSIGDFDYKFNPALKEYSGIPALIADHLRINHKNEFEVRKTRRRKR